MTASPAETPALEARSSKRQKRVQHAALLLAAALLIGYRWYKLAVPAMLRDAIQRDDAQAVEWALRLGADPKGQLIDAALMGKYAAVDAFLRQGVDPNDRKPDLLNPGTPYERPNLWSPPLYHIANMGRMEIIQRLVEHGADVNGVGTTGETPIEGAYARPEVMKYLLLRGADMRAVGRADRMLMRLIGGYSGSPTPEAVQFLLSHGAHADYRDSSGYTLLNHAINQGPLNEAVRTHSPFASQPRPPKDRDQQIQRHLRLVTLLLNKAAKVDDADADRDGNTPLMHSLSHSPRLTELLLEHGADPALRNKRGQTALEIAEKYGSKENAAVIRRYIAKHSTR